MSGTAEMPRPTLLSVERVSASYGKVMALSAVSMTVSEGEAVALIGANGAGKSTLFKTIVGLLDVQEGAMALAGRSLVGLPPEKRFRLGIGYSPEGRRVFPGLTVRENLQVAAKGGRSERETRLAEVFGLFPQLSERLDARGWQLSGGQQQMLAIGRALMGTPKLLLLDEPSLGLAPKLVDEVLGRIPSIVTRGTSVLLAEQNVTKALRFCDRAYVLEVGKVVLSGAAAELRQAEAVRRAYLGG